MGVGLDVNTTGGPEYTRMLRSAGPRDNPRIMSLALRQIALLTQSISTREKIHAGGRSVPLPRALTSRTGTGRRSIRTDFSKLPGEAAVGSDLKYMSAHEEGGSFSVKASKVGPSKVKSHKRTKAFGKTFSPFKVPAHTRKAHSRKAHTLKLPRRAWLEPAVDDVVPRRAEEIVAKNWQERLGVL